ncbi:MAG: MurR/RpiR family transcriptional regulator [Bacillaceae bacterium]
MTELLEKQLPKCSPAEKKVATFILENPMQITQMSTKRLAYLADSSQASIIRLCKRIGIDSFKKLKVQLSLELKNENKHQLETKEIVGNIQAISLESIIQQNINALLKTQNIIDLNAIEQAISLIEKSNKICFYGASESSLVAMDAYYKLIRINENVFFSQDSHISMLYATNMKEDDVLFLISLSGKTKEVLELIEVGKKRGVKIILLTQSPKSPASKQADVVLCTSKEELNLRIATMTTRITQLTIIDLIFTEICNKKGEQAVNYIIDTHNTIQQKKRLT